MKKFYQTCGCDDEDCTGSKMHLNLAEIARSKERQGDRKKKKKLDEKGETRRVLRDGKESNEEATLFNVMKKDKKEVWRKIEAAVDSGAVDTVGNPREFPGVQVEETKESRNDDCWISANGDEIPKMGEMDIKFQTENGQNMKMQI